MSRILTAGRLLATAQKIDEIRQIRLVSIRSCGRYPRWEIRVVATPINGRPRLLAASGPHYRPATRSGRGAGPAKIAEFRSAYLA